MESDPSAMFMQVLLTFILISISIAPSARHTPSGKASMYVCLCFGITDKHLKSAVQQGCCSYSEVRACTKVGMQCGKCACMAKQVVRDEIASLPPVSQPCSNLSQAACA